MTNTTAFFAEAALNHLSIHYRELPYRDGAFYFCKISDGLTFDLQLRDNGTIKMWRFVGTAPISNAGVRYEYRKPEYPHIAIGVEVTDEGDVSFYAEQDISVDNSRREERIFKMIKGYTELITRFSFENLSL